ncbi:MAG: hypothetical protein GY814_13710 [Gammaproteobacteria bacterium]|nr:hypothetical protein [Gammaproteobacteria bacterium]
MGISEHKETLLENYRNRDIEAIIRTVKELIQEPEFPNLYNCLCKNDTTLSVSVKVDEVVTALLGEIIDTEQAANARREEFATVTYFDISAELGKLFGKELAEIYLSTKMPDEFMLQVRNGYSEDEVEKLSEDLVERYRKEMVRIESGRQAVVDVLQKFSNFPNRNATTMSRLMERLGHDLKSNYKYLTIKPYLMAVFASGHTSCSGDVPVPAKESTDLVLFKHYLNTGEEPSIDQQARFRLAVNTLFRQIKVHEVLPDEEFRSYVKIISRVWGYRCPSRLTPNARDILEGLLLLVNKDQLAILKRLAMTFIEEFQLAEDRMKLFHNGIQAELAVTKEYLSQLSIDASKINSEEEEKIRIAQEKIIGLEGVFEVSPALERAARAKSFLELERTSLGLSISVSPEHMTEWIRIYSILYSNTEFLKYTDEKVDFSTMRNYISDLSTYHLILNVAQLKAVIDSSLSVPDADKHSHYTMFNEALKKRLHGMFAGDNDEQTLSEIIGELGFLENKSLQFIIAETFAGFQTIADAFTSSTSDYFVNDREALIRESRELYKQICNQCLKNFVVRPVRYEKKQEQTGEVQHKSWLTRLFS